jgi:release factor glutamine methyltransferase
MPEEIINHEPVHAFDGGPFGFKIFKKLIKHAPQFLHRNGMLLFEFGAGQDGMIKRFFQRSKQFKDIIFYEFDGEKRAVSAVLI